jgi:hypothetical protein
MDEFVGTEPVQLKTEAIQLFPDFTYPPLQVYSHFAAPQLSDTTFGVSALKPVSSPAHSVAFVGTAPVQLKTEAIQLFPDFTYPPLQVYSHFAAVSAATTVLGVSAARPVSSPRMSVAFVGTAPVQLKAEAIQLFPDFTYPPLQVYSHFEAVSTATKVRGVSAARPASSPGMSVAFAGNAPVQR